MLKQCYNMHSSETFPGQTFLLLSIIESEFPASFVLLDDQIGAGEHETMHKLVRYICET